MIEDQRLVLTVEDKKQLLNYGLYDPAYIFDICMHCPNYTLLNDKEAMDWNIMLDCRSI